MYSLSYFIGAEIYRKATDLTDVTKVTIKDLIHKTLVTEYIEKLKTAAEELMGIADSISDDKIREKLIDICGHAINVSRPFQDILSADTVPSSRVESVNSLIKRFNLSKLNRLCKIVTDILENLQAAIYYHI